MATLWQHSLVFRIGEGRMESEEKCKQLIKDKKDTHLHLHLYLCLQEKHSPSCAGLQHTDTVMVLWLTEQCLTM